MDERQIFLPERPFVPTCGSARAWSTQEARGARAVVLQDDGSVRRERGLWEFTSESVTEGHPDKICDQIADAVLDAIYEQDQDARVACEVATTTGLVLIMGEITTSARVDVARVARETIREIGYTRSEYGLQADSCGILVALDRQSPDIAAGVDVPVEAREAGAGAGDPFDRLGAGDQGLMFGYACRETAELMPLPITLAHRLAMQLAEVRKQGRLAYLRPDGKTQVTVRYQGSTPVAVSRVVVSAQHDPDVSIERLRSDIEEHVIQPVIPQGLRARDIRVFINPTGRFVVGGPHGDSGMSGRKVMVDTYGGMARHGGGSFSGKDPTKVDRSGAYVARYIAKNIVAADLAERCEVQVAYVIGSARPVSFMVDTFGTGRLADEEIARAVVNLVDLRPAAIIERFQLRRPIYRPLAAYGHFGRRDLKLPWEQTDLVQALRREVGLGAQPAASVASTREPGSLPG